MSIDCLDTTYDAVLIKNGVQLAIGTARLLRIEYNRVLDDVSLASVEWVTAGPDCCGQLGLADHWNTDLVILAGAAREVVWRGPLSNRVTYSRGIVRVDAQDNLIWPQVRIVQGPVSWTSTDVSTIFAELWADNVAAFDAPVHSLTVILSGVLQSRSIPASTNRRMWSIVQEMLDTGLDVTTYGEQVIVGMIPGDPIVLTDDDVQGSVQILKDGNDFANKVYVDIAKGILGEYPLGARTGSNGYPLVEILIEDGTQQNLQSAQETAKSRYDFSANGVRRVRSDGGILLLPTSGVNARRMVAGQLVNFTATQTCYQATETLRIGRIGFIVEAGKEAVTIDLQPLGGVEGLATI